MLIAAITFVSVVVTAFVLFALLLRALIAAHSRPQHDGAAQQHGVERSALAMIGRAMRLLLRAGVRLGPVMMLTVPGRRTGVLRSNPVDVFERDGRRWLVATHSGDAQWVRNLRAVGAGALTRGRHRIDFTARELPVDEAAAVMEAVVAPRARKRFGGVALRQTLGVSRYAGSDEFATAAATHPVFELTTCDTEQAHPAAAHGSRRVAYGLIGVGAATVLAHLALAVHGVLDTAGWVSGIVIGATVAGAGNHLRIFGHH